jgi:hypothetical protein
MVLAHARNEEPKQGGSASVAELFDFSVELGAIPTASLPSLENVGLVGIKDTSSIRGFASLWKGLRDKKLLHRLAGHVQTASNFPLRDRRLDGALARLHSEPSDWRGTPGSQTGRTSGLSVRQKLGAALLTSTASA